MVTLVNVNSSKARIKFKDASDFNPYRKKHKSKLVLTPGNLHMMKAFARGKLQKQYPNG